MLLFRAQILFKVISFTSYFAAAWIFLFYISECREYLLQRTETVQINFICILYLHFWNKCSLTFSNFVPHSFFSLHSVLWSHRKQTIYQQQQRPWQNQYQPLTVWPTVGCRHALSMFHSRLPTYIHKLPPCLSTHTKTSTPSPTCATAYISQTHGD